MDADVIHDAPDEGDAPDDATATLERAYEKGSEGASKNGDSVATDEAPKLSKNQQKKLARQKYREETRADFKIKRKEKHKAAKARKRAAEAATSKTQSAEPAVVKPVKSVKVPVTIIIDCQFDALMTDRELVSMASQVTRCYADNKNAPFKVNLAVSSFGGKLKDRFDNVLSKSHENWHDIHFYGEDFAKVAESSKDLMKSMKEARIAGALLESPTDKGLERPEQTNRAPGADEERNTSTNDSTENEESRRLSDPIYDGEATIPPSGYIYVESQLDLTQHCKDLCQNRDMVFHEVRRPENSNVKSKGDMDLLNAAHSPAQDTGHAVHSGELVGHHFPDSVVEEAVARHNERKEREKRARPSRSSSKQRQHMNGDAEATHQIVHKARDVNEPHPSTKAEHDHSGCQVESGETIYLTSDSPNTLHELKSHGTYIIGGIVDKNRHKGICYQRASDKGVQTAKLPIGEYLQMQSRKVLTTNHVNEIMLKWLETGDWGAAMMHVMPKRKAASTRTTSSSKDTSSVPRTEQDDEDVEDEDIEAS